VIITSPSFRLVSIGTTLLIIKAAFNIITPEGDIFAQEGPAAKEFHISWLLFNLTMAKRSKLAINKTHQWKKHSY